MNADFTDVADFSLVGVSSVTPAKSAFPRLFSELSVACGTGAGETVDILLDVTNPGRWMAHCHIAEHIAAGMMFSFEVAPR